MEIEVTYDTNDKKFIIDNGAQYIVLSPEDALNVVSELSEIYADIKLKETINSHV